MNDLISRQAVIDALYDWSNHTMTDAEAWHLRQVIGYIKSMSSAQPEKRTEKRTETHARDLIDRQVAIDALDTLCDAECEYTKAQRSVMCGSCHLGSAFDVIESLPPAQVDLSEYFTKLWQKAYERGKAEAQPEPGKWKKISPSGIYECSNCGRQVMPDCIGNYRFCHLCGAKMEEGTE